MCRSQCVLALVMLFHGLAHSWDVAVSAGDRLEFYTNGKKTDTVRFDSQNLTAIAYDEVHDILLYVDKQSNNDAICGFTISYVEYKCYTERNGRNIQGLAFDPITEILFFTDTIERSINWISFKRGSQNNVNGNLLIKMADWIPTDIAVDSCRGYIYWINTNLITSTIERARFNGSERKVIINAAFNLDLHSLAIDQQTQELYWFVRDSRLKSHLYRADLDGKHNDIFNEFYRTDKLFETFPNSLTISKQFLFYVDWCLSCGPRSVWSFVKPAMTIDNNSTVIKVHSKSPVGIVAKYEISEQIQGVKDCKAIASLVRNKNMTDDSLKIARGYVEPSCVHSMNVTEPSPCTPGYTGERCDVSVCENYCIQGNCSFNNDGLPKCRCNAGYSGDRCEVNVCRGYCTNNGICFLNEENEPFCNCIVDYAGNRCEVSDCLHYCIQGDCSYNEEGLPECRCKAGFSGERCEIDVCSGYCSNNGTCSLNKENEPVCQCIDDYAGDRCEVSDCLNYCIQGDCSINEDGLPECRCKAGFSGERCEVDVCRGYCSNNGTCSLNKENEPACQCIDDYAGDRCEVSDCLNYCIQGDCSINEDGLPECRCKASFSGERCEVDLSRGYCTNNGVCSLNKTNEPVCQCLDDYAGHRCDVSVSLNSGKPVTKISVVVEIKSN